MGALADYLNSHIPNLLSALSTPNPDTGVSPGEQIQGALASAGAAFHSPGALEGFQAQEQAKQAARDFNLRNEEVQSQLQTQDLNRQLLAKENANYQSPQQKQALDLDTQSKLLSLKRQFDTPELVPTTNADGTISYFQRKYNPATNDYDITPAMASQEVTVSSPDNPQIPYNPNAIVTRLQRTPLTSQNPDFVKMGLQNQLELQREKSLATDPDVLNAKIKVAGAEGAARANVDAAIARGSNAALANVPPHLVAAATADSTKVAQEYADAVSAADDMRTFIDLARGGNKVAYSYSPTEGVLTLNTARGVKRVNMPEIQSYAGSGSALDSVMAFLGKKASGASLPPDILDNMEQLHTSISANAQTKYANKLAIVNQNYGSNFQPVKIQGAGAGQTVQSAPPPGATMKVPGSDGKLHWSDGKSDLGIVQ